MYKIFLLKSQNAVKDNEAKTMMKVHLFWIAILKPGIFKPIQ